MKTAATKRAIKKSNLTKLSKKAKRPTFFIRVRMLTRRLSPLFAEKAIYNKNPKSPVFDVQARASTLRHSPYVRRKDHQKKHQKRAVFYVQKRALQVRALTRRLPPPLQALGTRGRAGGREACALSWCPSLVWRE